MTWKGINHLQIQKESKKETSPCAVTRRARVRRKRVKQKPSVPTAPMRGPWLLDRLADGRDAPHILRPWCMAESRVLKHGHDVFQVRLAQRWKSTSKNPTLPPKCRPRPPARAASVREIFQPPPGSIIVAGGQGSLLPPPISPCATIGRNHPDRQPPPRPPKPPSHTPSSKPPKSQ